MSITQFMPQIPIRNKHVQTILSSQKKPSPGLMLQQEQMIKITVNAEEMTHLIGMYTPQKQLPAKGLAILLHGWLGSTQSTYMLARGEQLYNKGYAIFRLNMRDHGPNTALNKGIFHGCRLEEVFQAIKQIEEIEPDLPITLIGFSMGGSFALRVGWRHSFEPGSIVNLKKIIAICPSVNPEQVTTSIDASIIYRRYFRNKWLENLIEKQKVFPETYDFSTILSLKTCWQITDELVKKYSTFPDIDAYFSEYHFSKEKLQPIRVPMTILAAKDDPVIPVGGFDELKNVNPLLNLHLTTYGGHVGYITNIHGDSWLDQVLPSLMAYK